MLHTAAATAAEGSSSRQAGPKLGFWPPGCVLAPIFSYQIKSINFFHAKFAFYLLSQGSWMYYLVASRPPQPQHPPTNLGANKHRLSTSYIGCQPATDILGGYPCRTLIFDIPFTLFPNFFSFTEYSLFKIYFWEKWHKISKTPWPKGSLFVYAVYRWPLLLFYFLTVSEQGVAISSPIEHKT